MPLLSVCIPTYEMKGLGAEYLRQSFDALVKQTFTDFDVVISDHSVTNEIEMVCATYHDKLSIRYYKNTRGVGSSSVNMNNAISHATGKLIKILFQDDFLYTDHALADIVASFDLAHDRWLVTACIHSTNGTEYYRPLYPRYGRDTHLGNNHLSSPSTLTIKNDQPLLFDERLLWLMDVEYYKRYKERHGMPKILNTITVVNRVGEHQVSNTLATWKRRRTEFLLVLNTYEHGLTKLYYWIIYTVKHYTKMVLSLL
jgi:glycosyltransferase involved in cell wall biosynthesis